MYIGSVRFFKHLILFSICIIIIGLTTTNIFLKLENNKLRNLAIDFDLVPDNVVLANNGTLPVDLTYQKMYPDLYAQTSFVSPWADEATKTIYLTFDDGPSLNTLKILSLLDKYNAKATFFMVYQNDEDSQKTYQEIVKRGHAIGVHTASHKYSEIYNSVQSYLADFDKVYTHIKQLTGVEPNIFRFPGGSINAYNVKIHQQLISEMLRRGFIYHDWNICAGDATSNATTSSIVTEVVKNVKNNEKSVILLHDKDITVTALEYILKEFHDSDYTFAKLDESVRPLTFAYKL